MPVTGYSMVRSYRRCPKQYSYKYIENLQRKKPAPPLIRGTIIHEMLNARAIVGAQRTPRKILVEYEEKYGSLFKEEQEIYGESFMDDIRRIYEGYLRTYGGDEDIEYEASEELVSTDLTPSIRFLGHLDKRLLTKKDGRRWLMDHKTHRHIPGEEQRFSDYQILMYVWSYNREHPKDKVDGIVWDYIRTKPPTIPEVLKKGGLTQAKNCDTDYHTYMRAIVANKLQVKDYAEYLADLERRSKHKFYQRIFLPNPGKAMVEQVVKDFRETSTIMHGLSVYPRNPTRDCSWCEYYRLCSAELRGLDSDFVRKTEFEVKEVNEDHSEEE
jgi:hypothetical protein